MNELFKLKNDFNEWMSLTNEWLEQKNACLFWLRNDAFMPPIMTQHFLSFCIEPTYSGKDVLFFKDTILKHSTT